MKEWNGLMLPRRRHAAKIPENMQRDGIAKAALHFHFFHSFYSCHVRAGSNDWASKRVWQRKWVSVLCICFFPLFYLAIFTSLFAFFSPSYTLYVCNALCYFCFSLSQTLSFFLIHFWLSSRESSNVGCWHNMLIFTNIILFAAKAFSADSYLLCARNICRITYAVLGHVKTKTKSHIHTHEYINLTLLVRFNATFTIIHFTCFAWQKIYL